MDTEKVKGLYLLQDGTQADPSDVSKGDDGVLRNKNGVAVALYADGKPQTIGEDAERNKNVEAANAGKEPVPPAPPPAPIARPASDVRDAGRPREPNPNTPPAEPKIG